MATEKQAQRQLEDILDICIDRMARGATPEQCLASYPELAEELGPLLAMARGLQGATTQEPSEEARVAVRRRLETALRERREAKPKTVPFWGDPWKGWVTAGALALILFFGGFGVVQASSDSLPGQALYPVKRAVEWVRLSRPLQSEDGRARLNAELALRRAHEMARVAQHHEAGPLLDLTERLAGNVRRAAILSVRDADRYLEKLEAQPGRPPGGAFPLPLVHRQRLLDMKSLLEGDYGTGLARLEAAAKQAPPDLQPPLQLAIGRFKGQYQSALEMIDWWLDPQRGPPGPTHVPMRRR